MTWLQCIFDSVWQKGVTGFILTVSVGGTQQVSIGEFLPNRLSNSTNLCRQNWGPLLNGFRPQKSNIDRKKWSHVKGKLPFSKTSFWVVFMLAYRECKLTVIWVTWTKPRQNFSRGRSGISGTKNPKICQAIIHKLGTSNFPWSTLHVSMPTGHHCRHSIDLASLASVVWLEKS